MAIEDAWVLADQLNRERQPQDALTRYVQIRLPRTSKVQAESRSNAGRFHHGNTLYYRPLQAVARLLPGLLIQRFDWLYQEDVTR